MHGNHHVIWPARFPPCIQLGADLAEVKSCVFGERTHFDACSKSLHISEIASRIGRPLCTVDQLAQRHSGDGHCALILVERSKGSRATVVPWGAEESALIDECLALSAGGVTRIKAMPLLHDLGRPITVSAYNSAFGRLKRQWFKAGREPFTGHDLKAAAVSCSDDPNFAGHKSEKARQVYERRPRIVKPTKVD